ncbi:T9SS type A sorting domain-containing protein [Aureispira anguillae]|uniref:T9SS type A sorting domain-containing protein n=1 Tax=Aureispira anguillae TaxID=2864201 RepID=A0A915YKV4_9BACT|nr:T9SS type A sorting domain-containing protein [Aureispira anguillae]BDS14812.1 T9SS type A sorting domain-containing protein [Aureispira anguillae]
MNKLRHFFLPILLVSMNFLMAQTTAKLEWAKHMDGGNYNDAPYDVITDAAGNVYITGEFTGTVDFDPGIGTLNLNSGSTLYPSIFIQKLDANGNLVWAKSLGKSYADDMGYALALDEAGSLYITGVFSGPTDFNPSPWVDTLFSNGGLDAFILKLDAGGNYQWAKALGGGNSDYGYAITTDTFGYVYASGIFRLTADLDPGPAVQNVTSQGGWDIYIEKLDTAGNLIWVKTIGGSSDEHIEDLITDHAGNIYLTGSFEGSPDFDPGAGTYSIPSDGNEDIFVQKLDSSGNFVWVNTMGGSYSDRAQCIKLDDAGNIYITGYFRGTADFDPSPATHNITGNGYQDIFIEKFDPAGNFLWVKTMGGTASDYGEELVLDANNDIYVVGSFVGTVDFHTGTAVVELTSEGYQDIFVQKIDNNGQLIWAERFGGTSNDKAYATTIGPAGNLKVSGYFRNISDFDPGPGVYNLGSTNSRDIFVLSLSECIPATTTITETVCNSYTAPDGQVYTASGQYTAELQSASGCDSIITIDLTVNHNQSSTIFETVCDTSYTAPNGIIYGSSGTYLATIPNAAGCDSTITIHLTVTSLDSSISKSGDLLTSNATNVTYQWIDCSNGNSPILGATNQTFTPPVSGLYAVQIAGLGCQKTSNCWQVSLTGINQVKSLPGVKIYPNPSQQFLYIEKGNQDFLELTIINNLGVTVLQEKTLNDLIELDLKKLPAGVFYLTVSDGKQKTSNKVIKLN